MYIFALIKQYHGMISETTSLLRCILKCRNFYLLIVTLDEQGNPLTYAQTERLKYIWYIKYIENHVS